MMNKTNVDTIDKTELLDLHRNAYIECTQSYLDADNVIGIFGTDLPLDLMYACNLLPVPLEGLDSNIFQFGTDDYSSVCDVIHSTLVYLKTQKCPILYSCKMYVVSTHCPMMYKQLKQATDKKVICYTNESELEKTIADVYDKTPSSDLRKTANEDLLYIETVLQKIDTYTTLDAETTFLLRYYTPYITSLPTRKKYFQQLENTLHFTNEKQNHLTEFAICPRGAYKNALKNKSQNIRLYRGWKNSDYGYKKCPFTHKENINY